MSKRSATRKSLPITRRQQVLALRQMKAEEVAANLADKIREAVKQEVEKQSKVLRDTMFDLMDRVDDLERNSGNGQERAETPQVSGGPEVVQEPSLEGGTGPGQEEDQGSLGG